MSSSRRFSAQSFVGAASNEALFAHTSIVKGEAFKTLKFQIAHQHVYRTGFECIRFKVYDLCIIFEGACIFYMLIYMLTAIGLTSGGSSAVHIYT